MVLIAGAVLTAYALGCLQTGYYLARFKTGTDLRRFGSGSTGARNAGRLLGRAGFAITLAGDTAKGAAALALARGAGLDPLSCAAGLVAVVAGHIWPVQLGFSGGRGVAPALGALVIYDPVLFLVLTGTAMVIGVMLRNSTRTVLAFAVLPPVAWWMGRPIEILAGITSVAVMILFTHRSHWFPYRKPAAPAPGLHNL